MLKLQNEINLLQQIIDRKGNWTFKILKLQNEINLLQQIIHRAKIINKKIFFEIITEFKKRLPLTIILKITNVKRSTYYYWYKNKTKDQLKEELYFNQQKKIKSLCQINEYFLGYRKITYLYQKTYNESISEKRVYAIMQKNGICCRLRMKKNKFCYKNNLKAKVQIVDNLINQDFSTQSPMQKLFTDITYFKTKEGFLYFPCIIDAFNNQIVASHVSDKQNKALVLNTIKKLPKLKTPCLFHSDQGTIYQSLQIQNKLTQKGFIISMSRKANPRDNAVIENFFGQMKSIIFNRHPFLFQDSKTKISKIINQFPSFWNQKWLLAKLNYHSPLQYSQNIR